MPVIKDTSYGGKKKKIPTSSSIVPNVKSGLNHLNQ